MTESRSFRTVRPGTARYVADRAELLAELALYRCPNVRIQKAEQNSGHDFRVTMKDGREFCVDVKGFSSIHHKIRSIESIEELRWRVSQPVLHAAKSSPCPVFLFLIDADTDHGRYIKLQDVAVLRPVGFVTVRFPKRNTLDREGVERLVAEL